MFKFQQESADPLRSLSGKKIYIDMGIELHPDGHTQKGESGHEHITGNLLHPGNARPEEIPHDDIGGDDDELKCQKDGCHDSTKEMNSIKDVSNFHKAGYPFWRNIIGRRATDVKEKLAGWGNVMPECIRRGLTVED